MTEPTAFDVATFGEAMLLLVAAEPGPIEHATMFHKRTAGAETNVAIGLARLGLKVGWAFAWRTLIAAELVFGVSSGSGGLGWYIFENRNSLETANVFAGLFFVILIGLAVENLLFARIEKRTLHRWGMQH